jgi:WD40 repeat protein
MAVAYTPDGKQLASASWDPTIRLWDPATGKELRRLTGHTHAVAGLAFTKDGKILASAGYDGMVRIWDTATGTELRQLKAHEEGMVTSVAVSPDGKTFASGGWQGTRTLVLWDLATGRELHVLGGKENTVYAIAFSPDGKNLVSADGGGLVNLWDVKSGKVIRTLQGHVDEVFCLAFAPDGKTLVSGDHDNTIRIWDMETGKQRRVIEVSWAEGFWKRLEEQTDEGPKSGVFALAFSSDGKTFASGHFDNIIRLWDAATGKELSKLEGHGRRVAGLAFSPDGKTLASGGWDHTIRFWDLATGKELHRYPGHDGYPVGVVVSPDSKQVLTAGGHATLRLWELATGKELLVFRGHSGWMSAAAFSPDGRKVASASSEDGTIHLWDVATGKQVWKRLEPSTSLIHVAFSQDGQYLATASQASNNKVKSAVRLLDPSDGKEIRTLKEMSRDEGFLDLAFTLDGKALAIVGYNPMIVWFLDPQTGREIRQIGIPSGWPLLSPDGRILVSNGGQQAFGLHEAETGKRLYGFGEAREDFSPPRTISPDGKTVAAVLVKDKGTVLGRNDTIRLWETATGQVRRDFKGHQGWINSLAFAPDGRTLVTASEDTTALVWDVLSRDGQRPAALRPNDLRQAWDDLAVADAATAFRSMADLAEAPGQAILFLRDNLKPVRLANPEQVAQWVADLGHDEFAERDQATQELEKLDTLAAPALRKALANQPELEARRRIEALLRKLDGPVSSPELLRGLRTIEVLEHIGTPQARQVVAALAEGAPAARLTKDAKAALERLTKRIVARP